MLKREVLHKLEKNTKTLAIRESCHDRSESWHIWSVEFNWRYWKNHGTMVGFSETLILCLYKPDVIRSFGCDFGDLNKA